MRAIEIDANNRILVARSTLHLMDMKAVAKDRHLQEHKLMLLGVKVGRLVQVPIEAI